MTVQLVTASLSLSPSHPLTLSHTHTHTHTHHVGCIGTVTTQTQAYARVFFFLLFRIVVDKKSGAVTTQAYARVFFLLLFSRGPIYLPWFSIVDQIFGAVFLFSSVKHCGPKISGAVFLSSIVDRRFGAVFLSSSV